MRSYLTFGSDDKVHWEQMETVQASGATQALNQARAQNDHNHYAVVPDRNWSAATPSVKEREPVIRWEEIEPDQMRIADEPLGQAKGEKITSEEARNVL